MGQLAEALAAAQAEISDPPRTKSGQVRGKRDYKYAGLDDLLQTVRPVLSRHGLAVVQTVDLLDGHPVLSTRLMHSAGGCISSSYPLGWDGGPQDHGSELTYARRYSLEAMVGVAATADDDAASAQDSRRPAPIPSGSVSPPGGSGLDASERRDLIRQIAAIAPKVPPEAMALLKEESHVRDPRTASADSLRALLVRVQQFAANEADLPEPGSDLGEG